MLYRDIKNIMKAKLLEDGTTNKKYLLKMVTQIYTINYQQMK